MWVWNRFLEQTGTIIYENEQELVSGLISYQTPYMIETGTRFAVVRRDQYIRKTDETNRAIFDKVIVQFGWDEIQKLEETGIQLRVGRTRLDYDGIEYRAIKVNDFGQKWDKPYIPMGVVEINFERRVPLAD